MIVSQLIEELEQMPGDMDVFMHYDGALRSSAELVWLAREGVVGICQRGEPIYYEDQRPDGAPSEEEDPYWGFKEEMK